MFEGDGEDDPFLEANQTRLVVGHLPLFPINTNDLQSGNLFRSMSSKWFPLGHNNSSTLMLIVYIYTLLWS